MTCGTGSDDIEAVFKYVLYKPKNGIHQDFPFAQAEGPNLNLKKFEVSESQVCLCSRI